MLFLDRIVLAKSLKGLNTGCVLNYINLWYEISEKCSFSPYMIKWAYRVKDFSNRLYVLTAVLLPPQTFVVKNTFRYILFLYTLYYGFGKCYFESFLYNEQYRLVRIIHKVAVLFYPGAARYVVSLLHWKFRRRHVSSQESDLVHASTPLLKLYMIWW